MAAAKDQLAQLDIVSPVGPSLAYHVGWIAAGALYVHGGINKAGSKLPSFRLHRFDFSEGTWSEVQAESSPALSHHVCVVISNRYAVIIGGWTGHERTSNVHVFDTAASRWCTPQTRGFPTGAGLSSHAAVALAGGDVVVVGREGSLRMQRKFGSMFLLRGDPAVGSSAVFTYSEFPLPTTSRSGHSAHVAESTLVVVGGRDDRVTETHAVEKGCDDPRCSTMLQLSQTFSKTCSSSKPMSGRKQHASACSCGVVLVHGGWTFDGKTRDPVGQMYALDVKSSRWLCLGESGVKRAGHVCCCDAGRVLLHGGEGPRGVIHGTLHQLIVVNS